MIGFQIRSQRYQAREGACYSMTGRHECMPFGTAVTWVAAIAGTLAR
jgi:hypothetical protein